jgi:hypothetical protein
LTIIDNIHPKAPQRRKHIIIFATAAADIRFSIPFLSTPQTLYTRARSNEPLASLSFIFHKHDIVTSTAGSFLVVEERAVAGLSNKMSKPGCSRRHIL